MEAGLRHQAYELCVARRIAQLSSTVVLIETSTSSHSKWLGQIFV